MVSGFKSLRSKKRYGKYSSNLIVKVCAKSRCAQRFLNHRHASGHGSMKSRAVSIALEKELACRVYTIIADE